MPRKCTVCAHPEREAIDAALVAGDSYRRIAAQFALSATSLRRHKKNHLPEALARAQDAHEVAQADDLLAQVRELQERALAILTKAERSGELRVALTAIREARGCIELLGKLAGELQQEGTVNIVLAPEWLALRTTILAALAPHPDARLAVARALEDGHAED